MSEILNLERSGKSNEGERDINVKERKGKKEERHLTVMKTCVVLELMFSSNCSPVSPFSHMYFCTGMNV